MTINTSNRVAGPYSGNGVTTVFGFSFKVFAATDLQIIQTDSTGAETTLASGFTVSLNSDQDASPGGNVTLTSALDTGYKLTITSSLSATQATDLTNQGGFYPKVITNALDKLTILIQQILGISGRQVTAPISDGTVNFTLPAAAARASKLLGFSSDGMSLVAAEPGGQFDSTLRADLSNTTSAGKGNELIAIRKTAAETTALVTVVNPFYPPGHVYRYGTNTTPGTTDMTAAIQAAINVSAQANISAYAPGDTYLVTDTLSMPDKAQIKGDHGHMYPSGGTLFNFAPSSAKSLFVPSGAPAAFRYGYHIEGIRIVGNSASSSGNSIYAIDCYGWNNSRVTDVTISGFRTGIRCYATILNRFEFVKIVSCYIYCVEYGGGVATTDNWVQPYFGTSPTGVNFSSLNLAIEFWSPTFESLASYGMNIARETYGIKVFGGYAEDTPSTNTSTLSLFRVGFDGTATSAAGVQLTIVGGNWGGRNAGAVGAMMDVDLTDGVKLGGFTAYRYTNVVRTSVNTLTKQVVCLGWDSVSVSTQVSDETKVSGFFGAGVFNGSRRNDQTMRMSGDQYTDAGAACTGAITTSAGFSVNNTGGIVALQPESVVGTASAVASFSYGNAIPLRFRPSAEKSWPIAIKNNGATVSQPGLLVVTTAGVITVYRDINRTTAFTAAASAGWADSASSTYTWTI